MQYALRDPNEKEGTPRPHACINNIGLLSAPAAHFRRLWRESILRPRPHTRCLNTPIINAVVTIYTAPTVWNSLGLPADI